MIWEAQQQITQRLVCLLVKGITHKLTVCQPCCLSRFLFKKKFLDFGQMLVGIFLIVVVRHSGPKSIFIKLD